MKLSVGMILLLVAAEIWVRFAAHMGAGFFFLLYSCAREQSPLIPQTSACRLIEGIWDCVSVPWHLLSADWLSDPISASLFVAQRPIPNRAVKSVCAPFCPQHLGNALVPKQSFIKSHTTPPWAKCGHATLIYKLHCQHISINTTQSCSVFQLYDFCHVHRHLN